jgi:hypothetical protein
MATGFVTSGIRNKVASTHLQKEAGLRVKQEDQGNVHIAVPITWSMDSNLL